MPRNWRFGINMKHTKDILFVAWLEVKGKPFKNFSIVDEEKRIASFSFEMESHDWNEYKKEFYGSETTKSRYALQRIKDLMN